MKTFSKLAIDEWFVFVDKRKKGVSYQKVSTELAHDEHGNWITVNSGRYCEPMMDDELPNPNAMKIKCQHMKAEQNTLQSRVHR